MSNSLDNLVPDSYVHFKGDESAVELPTRGPYAFSAEGQPTQLWQPWVDPDNPPTQDAPTSFKPTSLSVYSQHSRGLWQPTNGNNSSVFVIMMSTRNNVDNHVWTINDNVAPLAHYTTLADAYNNMEALVQQYENAIRIVEDLKIGRYFKIVGKHKTRTIWIREVGHARSLKMINLDDVDGGMYEDWVGNGQVKDEKPRGRPFEDRESGSETDASAFIADDSSE